ncbi:Uncharacterised protein [uncultured archaeon]|nr:Uncharacterised protein [uncultured archaeon]
MPTVQHLVKKELESNPLLLDILLQEIANINSVAVKMRPAIEKELGKKAKLSAVSMAIRRTIAQTGSARMFSWKFPKNLEVATKSNVYEIAIEHDFEQGGIFNSIRRKIKKDSGSFVSFMEGTYETVIITNQRNKWLVKKELAKKSITSEEGNLGCVSVGFDKSTKNIPGIYYQITRALAYKNIPINSFFTIGSEMAVLVKEQDLLEAHKCISSLIKKNS